MNLQNILVDKYMAETFGNIIRFISVIRSVKNENYIPVNYRNICYESV